MKQQVEERLAQYLQERNALVTEANERIQKHQTATVEHNNRIAEIQTRIAQIEGGMQALQELLPQENLESPQSEAHSAT